MRPATAIVWSFAVLIAIGTLLLSLPVSRVDGGVHPFAALFTATSAVCVTGLVVVDTATAFTTFGQVVILILIQLGGLGYMTFAAVIAILLGKELGMTERILLRESYGQSRLAGVVRLTRNTLLFTLSVELIGAVILTVRFAMDPNINGGSAVYYGVFHAVSAFCNAGFDLMGAVYGRFASFTAYTLDPIVSLTIAGMFIIAGLGYPVVEEIVVGRKRYSLHTRLVLWTSLGLLVAGTVAVLTLEWTNPRTLGDLPLPGKLLASFFQSATARTAGFNTIDTGSLHPATLFLLSILMFIGASPGGTGGGVKTTTFVIVVIAVLGIIRGRTDSEVFGRRIPTGNVYRALAITLVAIVLVVVGLVVLAYSELQHGATESVGFLALQFEILSAWGTVGLSTGITPMLSPLSKLVLILTMFVGRVGPLTAFAALAATERPVRRRLAEEDVVIGS